MSFRAVLLLVILAVSLPLAAQDFLFEFGEVIPLDRALEGSDHQTQIGRAHV